MPSFVSNGGKWEPAHERAFDPKTGEIYDGPDREAVKYIEQEGTVGKDALTDPELKMASRNMGFNTVEEYLKYFEPTAKQVEDKKAADLKIVTHSDPIKKAGINKTGSKGGFYDPDKETPELVMGKKL